MNTAVTRRIRSLAVAAAILGILGLGVVGASPAHAVSLGTLTVTSFPATFTVTANVGDTFDVTNSSGGTISLQGPGSGIYLTRVSPSQTCNNWMTWCSMANGNTSTYTVNGTGSVYIYAGVLQQGTITISSANGGNGSGSSGSTPAPVLQQFGLPSSGRCDEGSVVGTLNWGGAGSGGWGNSWAQWANGGNGGAVCTRTLVYSNAASHWIVG